MKYIRIHEGGFINKIQIEYEPIKNNNIAIKNENKNIYNDDESFFYSIPLIEKTEILTILRIIKRNTEIEKEELQAKLEQNARLLLEKNDIYELVLQFYIFNSEIDILSKLGKSKAINNLENKKEQIIKTLNIKEENIKDIFEKIPQEYKDLNIKNIEDEKSKIEKEIRKLETKISKLSKNISAIVYSFDNNFSKENINEDLRTDFNDLIKRKKTDNPNYNEELLKKYNKVFNTIVPIYFYKENKSAEGHFFNFLKGEMNEEFILIKKAKNIFKSNYVLNSEPTNYELYRSSNDFFNVIILHDNFTFKKLQNIKSLGGRDLVRNSVYKIKDIYYPVLKKKSNKTNQILESFILSTKKSVLIDILLFYKNYIGDTFKNWFNSFGVITETNTIIFHDKIDILHSFIITNNFKIYIGLYKKIKAFDHSVMNQEHYKGDISQENEKNIEAVLIEKRRNIKYKNLYSEKYNSDLDPEFLKIILFFDLVKTIIKTNDFDEDSFYRILFKIMEKINIKPEFQKIIFHIYIIIKQDISIILNEISYSYNFLKINNLYSLVENSIENIDNFTNNISDLNKFIKFDMIKINKLFIIDLTQELFNYYLLNIPKNNFIKVLLYYFYFNSLHKNEIIKNLTNSEEQFVTLLYNKEYPTDVNIALDIDDIKRISGDKNIYYELIGSSIFYKNLFFSDPLMNGFKCINYGGKNRLFDDPRGDKSANTQTRAGRPFCGEIALLNIINLLLWNPIEKKIEASYFPDTVSDSLKNFFIKNTNIDNFETPTIYTEFYLFLENIPFKLKKWEKDKGTSTYNRDYGDTYVYSVYRYFKEDSTDPYKIEKGIELRLTYFNLCRVLSYLLNLNEPELKLEYIQDNLDGNTFKNLISKFKNPNIEAIKNSYVFSYGESSETDVTTIFNTEQKIIKILSSSTRLGGHSEMDKIADNQEIKGIIKQYFNGTFYNHAYENNDDIYDILQSVYVAKMKGNEIYSEIRFDKIKDEDSIKLFQILKNIENFNIPLKLIKSLIKDDKHSILIYIFDNFNIYGKEKWTVFIKYMIKIKNENLKGYFETYLKIFKNKININTIIDNITKEIFLEFLKFIEYIDFDINKMDIDSIKNYEFFIYITNESDNLKKIQSNRFLIGKYINRLLFFKLYDLLFENVKEHRIDIKTILYEYSDDKYLNITDDERKDFFDKLIVFFRNSDNYIFLTANQPVVPLVYKEIDKHPVYFIMFRHYLQKNLVKNIQISKTNSYKIFMFLLKQTLDSRLMFSKGYELDDLNEIIINLFEIKYKNIGLYENTFKIINGIIEKNNEYLIKNNVSNFEDYSTFNFNSLNTLFENVLRERKLHHLNMPKEKEHPQLWKLAKNLQIDLKSFDKYHIKYLKYKKKYLNLVRNIR